MFESLSDRLSGVFDRLTKQGALSEDDVKTALREVRVALLEADVSLPVARDFIKAVQDKASGQAVTKSVTPGQQVVKIVHDELIQVLAGDNEEPGELKIDNPPAPILMVGLQGGGKTTTTAKLAKRLTEKNGKRVLMASLDVNRPPRWSSFRSSAARSASIRCRSCPAKSRSISPSARNSRQPSVAMTSICSTPPDGFRSTRPDGRGRGGPRCGHPRETLLVVDGLTGQDAVHTAENFDERIGISGVVLTRMDGDGRGGAALSMRAVTGKPIKFVGLGEKLDALEEFHPNASRAVSSAWATSSASSRKPRKPSRPNRPSA